MQRSILKIFFCVIMLFSFLISSAQESLKTADDYFKKQDFEKALQYLQIILNNPQQLKGDEHCFALLLKAKSQINLLDRAVKNKDSKNIEKYKDAYFLAYQDLLEAPKFMSGEAAKKEYESLKSYLHRSITSLGAGILNKIYNDAKMTDAAKDAALDEAQKYLMASISLKADDYSACDLYGQVMMLKKADDDALVYFEKSKKYFAENKSNSTDFGHFRVYANMSIIQLNRKNGAEALNTIETAKSNLENHYQRIVKKDSLSNREYLGMKSLLQNIENDIFLNSPELAQKAIEKFNNQIKTNPAELSARFSLAQIYEQQNMYSEAAAEYESLLKIDSTNRLANYNLGILYLNEAIGIESKINPENADPKFKSKFTNLLQRSESSLKKALGPEEKDIECIDALLKTYTRLQNKEAYQYYRNLKTALLKSK
jgi:predicted Zn-dependent protease